jgi:hypothetical protein
MVSATKARSVCLACQAQPVRHAVLDGMKHMALIAGTSVLLSMVRSVVLGGISLDRSVLAVCVSLLSSLSLCDLRTYLLACALPTLQSSTAPALANAVRNTTYEEELMASVKARGGSGLPSLTASPVVEAPKVEKKAPVAAPAPKAEAPTPRPSINGKELPADAPTITLPSQAAAPAKKAEESLASYASSSYTAPAASKAAVQSSSTSSEGGNNNAVVLGGAVLVAIAGVVLAGGNNGEGESAAGAAGAAGGMGGGVAAAPAADANVAEARAWIAAWKKKHGKA